jgi:DNA invertase Pin-like site-specific DNA recombinase
MTDPLFASCNRARDPGDRSRPVLTNGAQTPPITNAKGPPQPGLRHGEPVLGYVSAPGTPDATGRDPSQRAIELACGRSGWLLLDVLRENGHHGTERRPALAAALDRVADGEARGLVVSHARLLGDSIIDLAALMSWFREARAAFVALDLGLDTSTPQGTRVAMALIRLSGWHRDRAVDGRRHGLAALAARSGSHPNGAHGNGSHRNGAHRNGSHLLAVAGARAELHRRLAAMEDDDMSLQEMADQLNAEGMPTLSGRDTWWPSSVRTALRYAHAKSVARSEGVPSLEDRTRT